ncbi:MAG: DUF4270 domain-containing protein [Prevotellaceae bacterium]|nr:DUF4270 domain-containing protein [Prevotellaceae bacterium]
MLYLLLAQACTKVDKTLGENFIPPNERLKVQTRDATGFLRMANIPLDSISTSSFSTAVLGRTNDARLGKTTAGFVAQFLPASYTFTFEDGVTKFDSVCLILGFSSTYGSDKTPMNIEVYELETGISIDSAYYEAPEVAKRVAGDVDLAAGNGNGPINAESSMMSIRLTNSEDLFNRLFSYTSSADSFLTYFRGLYVKVDDNAANGCIKSVSLVNTSTSYASSAIVAYYTYTYTDDEGVEKDSLTSFTYHVFSSTPRFNVFDHDNSHLQSATDTLYMQGLAGVVTKMTISQDSVEAWGREIGAEKKNYAISRAELVLHVQDEADYAALDLYATQLQGITLSSSGTNGKYAAIWDMYAGDGSFSSIFDGALNRSQMQYSINITHYFNTVMKDGETSPLILMPYDYTSDARSVLINNKDEEKKPQLKITYVEIKE